MENTMEPLITIHKRFDQYFRLTARHITPNDLEVTYYDKEDSIVSKGNKKVIVGVHTYIGISVKTEVADQLEAIYNEFKDKEQREKEEIHKLIHLYTSNSFGSEGFRNKPMKHKVWREIVANGLRLDSPKRKEKADALYHEISSKEFRDSYIERYCKTINGMVIRYQKSFDTDFERWLTKYFLEYQGYVADAVDKKADIESEEIVIKTLKEAIDNAKETIRLKRIAVVRDMFIEEQQDMLKDEPKLIEAIEEGFKEPNCWKPKNFFR